MTEGTRTPGGRVEAGGALRAGAARAGRAVVGSFLLHGSRRLARAPLSRRALPHVEHGRRHGARHGVGGVPPVPSVRAEVHPQLLLGRQVLVGEPVALPRRALAAPRRRHPRRRLCTHVAPTFTDKTPASPSMFRCYVHARKECTCRKCRASHKGAPCCACGVR